MKKAVKNLCLFIPILILIFACSSDNGQTNNQKVQPKKITHDYKFTDFYALAPLQVELGKPAPGDWLFSNDEKGQSYIGYKKRERVCPDDSLYKISILPVGKFNDMEWHLLKNTADYVSMFFMMEVELLGAISDEVVPEKSRRPNYFGEQLHTKFILDSILCPNIPEHSICFISITNKDLYPADDWNFVFGQAYLTKRTGVSSYRKYFENQIDTTNYEIVFERIIKTTTHELCHMFSLKHCSIYKCLLNGSNHMFEADSKPLWLCPECLAKLQYCIKFDLEERYDILADYFKQYGMVTQQKFYEKSKALMFPPKK